MIGGRWVQAVERLEETMDIGSVVVQVDRDAHPAIARPYDYALARELGSQPFGVLMHE
jgi:hypothetical protein